MLILDTKDFGRIACHKATAAKFPVLRQLFDGKQGEGVIAIDFISGAALQTLLSCAERHSDLENCSHNAKELATMPHGGRAVRCSEETLQQIKRHKLLGLDAELECSDGPKNNEDTESEYLIHLRMRGETECVGEQAEYATANHLADDYKSVNIYCDGDGGTIRCQVATAKKFAILRPILESMPKHDGSNQTLASSWNPLSHIHLECVRAQLLSPLIRCAERSKDHEPCSHTAHLRNNLTKKVCIDQATLDAILENEQFGLDGQVNFKVAPENGYYFLSIQLAEERTSQPQLVPLDPMLGIVKKHHLRVQKLLCKDGEFEYLFKTIEKCPLLASHVYDCRRGLRKPPLRYAGVKALKLFLDLGLRRDDIGRHDTLADILVPGNGRRLLAESQVLMSLTKERMLFRNCKMCCTASNVSGFFYVRLIWEWEAGYAEASKHHFSLDVSNSFVRNQLQPHYCMVECAHGTLLEFPLKVVRSFPNIWKLWRMSQRHATIRLPYVSAFALSALLSCALATTDKSSTRVPAFVFHEIFALKSKSFEFAGKLHFEQDDHYKFFRIRVHWWHTKDGEGSEPSIRSSGISSINFSAF